MGIEPMALGLALRRSNHWATETPHLNHHIQVCYHPTANNIPVTYSYALSSFYVSSHLSDKGLYSCLQDCVGLKPSDGCTGFPYFDPLRVSLGHPYHISERAG